MQINLSSSELRRKLKLRTPIRFEGYVYRIVERGRVPTEPSNAKGRWGDGTFKVLYTSLDEEVTRAEIAFHLIKAQPIAVSKQIFEMHKLFVVVEFALDISRPEDMTALGVNTNKYGKLDYGEHKNEYPSCQVVARTAYDLQRDGLHIGGLLVPSARYKPGVNLVIFHGSDSKPIGAGSKVEVVEDLGPVKWTDADLRPMRR